MSTWLQIYRVFVSCLVQLEALVSMELNQIWSLELLIYGFWKGNSKNVLQNCTTRTVQFRSIINISGSMSVRTALISSLVRTEFIRDRSAVVHISQSMNWTVNASRSSPAHSRNSESVLSLLVCLRSLASKNCFFRFGMIKNTVCLSSTTIWRVGQHYELSSPVHVLQKGKILNAIWSHRVRPFPQKIVCAMYLEILLDRLYMKCKVSMGILKMKHSKWRLTIWAQTSIEN